MYKLSLVTPNFTEKQLINKAFTDSWLLWMKTLSHCIPHKTMLKQTDLELVFFFSSQKYISIRNSGSGHKKVGDTYKGTFTNLRGEKMVET